MFANFAPFCLLAIILWLTPSAIKNNVKCAFAHIQAPISSTTISLEDIKNTIKTKIITRSDLIKYCEGLLHENLLLKSRISDLNFQSQQTSENDYKIGNFITKHAKVIRRDIATWANEITINVGSLDGISKGMGVVSNNHAIGRIKSTSKKTSIVELVTSPQFRMVCHAAADIKLTPIIFSGGKSSSAINSIGEATNVPTYAIGDDMNITLVTSSLTGIFPNNIIVGEIHQKFIPEENYFSSNVSLDNNICSRLYEVAVLIEERQ